jgi:aminopeptidase N
MKSWFLVLILLPVVSFAQEMEIKQNSSQIGKIRNEKRVNYSGHHSYNVIEYKLSMDWYDILNRSSNSYFGIMQIKFCPDLVSPLGEIDIDDDTTYLHVDSVFANSIVLQFNIVDTELNITLDKQYSARDTGIVTLYYHVVDKPANQQKGFYYYYAGEQPTSGYTVPHTIAYTMSEPSDAHDWMPCYDDPSDKALCEISIRVPNGYVAASNGTLESKIDNHDGSTTFDWSENYPIATYLMCATAAQFAVVQRSYTKSDGSVIPVQYYVYPEDSSGAVSNSECDIDTVASMVQFYESLYGTFPFDKYGMTGIEPFQYGGMEHQTITTLLRKYEFNRSVVAHELAHQWWGDMVTLGTWNDIWLNEGFATYSEAMQLQHLSQSSFESEMQSYENEYFGYDTVQYAIYAPQAQGAYIFDLVEYYKGAWVLSMLRNIVGDSTFFAIFRTYRSDFQFGNAVTNDFENVVNQVTRLDMSWFFNEWIFQAGYPVYSYTYKKEGSSLVFYLKQTQMNGPIFKMPIEFTIYFQGQKTVGSFVDSTAAQTFTMHFLSQPDSVVFDPNNAIMKQMVTWDTTIPYSSISLNNFPNPFRAATQITYTIPAGSKVSFEIYDVLGRKVKTFDEGYQEANTYNIKYDAHDLASGVYICRMTTGFGNKVIKLLLEK